MRIEETDPILGCDGVRNAMICKKPNCYKPEALSYAFLYDIMQQSYVKAIRRLVADQYVY